LVHAGNEDGPDETDDPSTEGRRRHRGIICVGNGRTDFWIWGLILKRTGRWVKIWVVIVLDRNALRVSRQIMSGFVSSPLRPRGGEIRGKKILTGAASK